MKTIQRMQKWLINMEMDSIKVHSGACAKPKPIFNNFNSNHKTALNFDYRIFSVCRKKIPDISLIFLKKSNSLIFPDLDFFFYKIPWYSSSVGTLYALVKDIHATELVI